MAGTIASASTGDTMGIAQSGVSGAIFFKIVGASYPMTYYRNPQATNGIF
jgi:hypothetical protein